MEWLKDKKNQPIVIGVAVFLLLLSGGFIAWQQGVFGGTSSDQVTSAPPPPSSAPSSVPPVPTGGPAFPRAAMPGLPAAATTAATTVKPVSTDPTKGPDPFAVPGSLKKIASSQVDIKPPLSAILPPMNLYTLRSPTPPQAPTLTNSPYGQNQGSNYRLAGIVNGSDGNINAILDLNGQTQTVKPGDALPDGSRVTTIQSTSVTLRTGGGTTISLPLSGGTPDPGTQPGQYNVPPGYNGPPPGFVPPTGPTGPPPGFVYPTGPPPGFVPPGFNNNVGD